MLIYRYRDEIHISTEKIKKNIWLLVPKIKAIYV